MAEIVGAFLGAEGVEEGADAGPQILDCSLGGLAQQRLEFGEEQLDRVEVGGVGRQVAQGGAGRFDRLAHAGHFVRLEIVHDDEVAFGQGRDQALADIGQEDCAIHRVIDDKGRGDLAAAQSGDKGGDLPVAVRHPANEPRAAPRATTGSGHISAGAGLVDEHQVGGIKGGLIVPPALARLGDVGTFLLAGVQNFF